jgi:aminoglycoside 6'-N-acetyltransferase
VSGASASVMWPPVIFATDHGALTIRQATLADVAHFARWDLDPDVIACSTDDPEAEEAFGDVEWTEEIAANSAVSCHYIAELNGRPVGAMQIIDPHLEPTHYWGEIEPNLRAIDIWIGAPEDRGIGLGAAMMRAVIDRCFADGADAIVIDPLASNTRAHRFYERLGFHFTERRSFGDDACFVFRLERTDWAVQC